MAIDVKLFHRTHYSYDRPVTMGPQIIRLRPAPHCLTEIPAYSMEISPAGQWVNWQQDPFSNYLARVVFPEQVREFGVTIDLIARLEAFNPFDFFLEDECEYFPFEYSELDREDLRPYLRKPEGGELFDQWVRSIDRHRRRVIDFISELSEGIHGELSYLIRMEPGVQSPEETLRAGKGSCRDFAWLFVNVLRHFGLAARFVSGYSIQLTADVKALDGPSGVEKDICDLHAWTEVYLPGAGWVGVDSTSGLFCGEGHLPLACTPEPRGAAPITGEFSASGKVQDEFKFEMSIARVHETPRVTLPYREDQWERINLLGRRIDERLKRGDVRLTMGGEPTFVSIDDFESPEWTVAALGEQKRLRGEHLLRKLFDRYGAGGFLHYGQGKWYPGESLPRWAYSGIWRRDGEPLWKNPGLFADISKNYGFGEKVAGEFVQTLSANLGLDEKHIMPAYEDAWYYMWKERRLPVNVNPLDNRLEEEEERVRLAKIFEQGLKKTVGYALPLERGWVDNHYRWITGPWFLRPETMFLIPGDSPMGLRLPLDSVPWAGPSDLRSMGDWPIAENVPPLPKYEELARQYARAGSAGGMRSETADPWRDYLERAGYGQGFQKKLPPHMRPRPELLEEPEKVPVPGKAAPWIVRTALCAEPREGRLHLFLPPVHSTEDYIDLLTAIEATAEELDRPVVLEGYLPPYDPRLETIKIAPDPGVLEVNIQPSADWDHLVDKTTFLYEAARECRLGTEKFDEDGTHTGTGGGNHIVVGAASPHESPFLRNPKLLASLVSYWHNHPSLSYLFSGKFIGPTSQAPRLDEARNDSVYEIEIAFQELDRQLQNNQACPPWLVDRIFRNLLIDVSGNTHRAEFCIDKLYSPDGSAGRLGLLEQRAYEMPPHARMSLTQHLLLRGLIARFWEQPYEPERLVRWDTQLHDRWMLPHFIMEDMRDVCEDLTVWGEAFDPEWFVPHYEFRFPKFGDVNYRGINLEIRQALEPWHVLGEENVIGGTARYVDSSVERIQVKVRDLVEDRYVVSCNGFRLPLSHTGTEGEFVAGVRYRAWQPPLSLHPTIPVDSPLRLEIIDKWNNRSIGGCQYHVAHPGGMAFTDFPVNALAAETRRRSRFLKMGHSVGETTPELREKVSPDFPMTLDLREPPRLPTY